MTKTQIHISIILGLLGLASLKSHALEPFNYQLALHENWTNNGGYFDFGAAKSANEDVHKAGFEAGISYVLPQAKVQWPLYINASYVNFSDLNAENKACASTNCNNHSQLTHSALLANVGWLLQQTPQYTWDIHAGMSYVFAKGHVDGVKWHNNAIGQQMGTRIIMRPNEVLSPYLGLRIHHFETEYVNHAAQIVDVSLIFGIDF